MSRIPLGIDVAKDSFVAAFKEGARETFPNDPEQFDAFETWLDDRDVEGDQLHVCLETTGTYSLPLAAWLVEQGLRVSVINPARVQGFATSELQRNKTDRSDARLLARFCEAHEPAPWTPQDEAWAELKRLTRRIQQLQKMRTQEMNRLQTPDVTEATEASLEAHLDMLDTQIEQMWARIDELITSHDKLQAPLEWVQSIPGLGRNSAIMLIAEIQDIERFASAKKLAAYAGVTPENRQSGRQSSPASMSKQGSRRLRRALYMPAMAAQRYNPVVSEFCERLEARGKDAMTVVGAAMHKLIRLVYGVWSNEEPFDPEYAA